MSRIVLNRKNVIDKITEGGFKCIRIYEGFVNPTEEKQFFSKYVESSTEEALDKLTRFMDTYHSTFTLACRAADGGAGASTVFRLDTNPEVKPVEAAPQLQGAPALDPQKVYLEALEKIKGEMQLMSIKRELEYKTQELNGLHGQGDRLAYVATKVIEGFFMKGKSSTTKAATLGGFSTVGPVEEAKAEVVEETTKKEPANLDKKKLAEAINILVEKNQTDLVVSLAKDKAALAASFKKLIDLLGEADIIKLSNKLQPNSMELNLVKGFVNN